MPACVDPTQAVGERGPALPWRDNRARAAD